MAQQVLQEVHRQLGNPIVWHDKERNSIGGIGHSRNHTILAGKRLSKQEGVGSTVLYSVSTNSNLVPYLRQQESRNGVDERSIRFSAMKNIAVVRLQPQFLWATRLKASREQGICFPIIMKQLSTKRPLLLSRKKNNAAVTLKWMKMEFIARKPDTQQKSEFLDLSKKNRLLDRTGSLNSVFILGDDCRRLLYSIN